MLDLLKTLLLKVFKVQTVEISDERIAELEAQGHDMSQYRAANEAKRAEQRAAYDSVRQQFNNPTNLSRLEPYKAIPRSTDSDFFQAIAGKEPMFKKDKWLQEHSESPIVYMGIAMAQDEGYRVAKQDENFYAVSIVATDEAHRCNEEWLQRILKRLEAMALGEEAIPSDCKELVDMMREVNNEGDWRNGMLGQSIAEGATAYYRKEVMSRKDLPQGKLPSNHILPKLCTYIPDKASDRPLFKAIPPQFYI